MPTFSVKLARFYGEKGEFGKAMANWLAILKCQPQLKPALKTEFLSCFSQFVVELERHNQRNSVVDYFLMAQQLYQDCPDVFVQWGQFLFRNHMMEEATFCFGRALDLDSGSTVARQSLRNLSSHVIDQWHFRMLNDLARNSAYERAISLAMCNCPSGAVLDIGAGTGLLSMLALVAGAASIYACEMSKPMVDVAKRVLRDNEMEERISLVNKMSTEVTVGQQIPRKVSMVISEVMDAGLYGEGILQTLMDAKKRLLAPDGIIIPNRAKVYGMLIQSDSIRRSNVVERSGGNGLPVLVSDCTQEAVKLSGTGDPYASEYMKEVPFKSLSSAFKMDDICFNDFDAMEQHMEDFCATLNVSVNSAGRIDAVMGWFEVELYDGVTINTGLTTDTMWEQTVYPCGRQLNIAVGSAVEVRVRLAAGNRLEVMVVGGEDVPVHVAKAGVIGKMNDQSYRDFYTQSFNTADVVPELLDMTDVPVVAELALQRGWKTTIISDSDEVFEAFINDRLPGAMETAVIHSCDHIESLSAAVTLISVDPVDHLGMLKQRCLEDLALCRVKLNVDMVVPSKVVVMGRLVESSELWGWTCVTADRNTLGLRIRDRINVFQTNLQLDVGKGVEWKFLSEPQQLMTLDLCEKLMPNSAGLPKFVKQTANGSFSVTDSGNLHAVLVWYRYHTGSILLDTLQAESFHQAAYMLDGRVLSPGCNVPFLLSLANSEISVELID